MTLSGRYFIPGPVEIDPQISRAMLHPMINHRSADGTRLVARLQPGLRAILGTSRPVMLATSSATAMMEAAIRSGVDEHVLCVVSGTFGERFAKVAEQCGREVTRLHVHRGDVLEPEMLERLHDGPPVDAVTMVHCETSTGALAPIEALLARFRTLGDPLTIVDAVSSAAGTPVPADRWGADFVFTSSQKAMGLPPGLAFGVASDRMIERAHSIDDRGWYLDLVDLLDAALKSEFPQTPALPIVFALDAQLERIEREGLAERFARHRAMRERVEAWVAGHGRCDIMAPPGYRSDTVTALTLREGRSAIAIAAALKGGGRGGGRNEGGGGEDFEVATGLETDIDRVIRIGHMGDLLAEQLDPLFATLEPLL